MDTLSWLWANPSLLFLLNAACLAEKQQIPIEWSLVCPACGLNPLSTTLETSMLIFNTTDEVWRGLICEQKQSDNNSLFNPAIFFVPVQCKGPGFQMSFVMVFFVFNELRWEVVACFVDIGGIVDHHCFQLTFHKTIVFIFKICSFVQFHPSNYETRNNW